MPKPTKGPRFGGSPAHQRIILANLATQLFQHGRITTTEAKAKRVQPVAERLISKAKRGDLHNRRQVLSVVKDSDVVHHLFADIAPSFADREGGYTRITKIGPRKGDNAPMAIIEIVKESVEESRKAKGKKGAAKKPASAKAAAEPEATEEAVAEPEAVEEPEAAEEVVEEKAEATESTEEAAAEEVAGEAGDEKPAGE